MATSNKKAKIVYGHYLSNAGRIYYGSLMPMKAKKAIDSYVIKTDSKECDSKHVDEIISKLSESAENNGYKVQSYNIETRNEIYKQI